MTACRVLALLVLAATLPLLGGCSSGRTARVDTLLGGQTSADRIAGLAPGTTRQAWRIHGFPGDGPTDVERIHGYEVVSGPVAVPDALATRLAAVLLDDDTYEWEMSKACEFMPGVAVRWTDATGTTDVLFCFSCEELGIWCDGARAGHEDFDSRRAELAAVMKLLFPDDAKIQEL